MSAPPHPHAIILVKEKRHGPSWAAPRSTAPRRDSGQLGGCRTGETKAVGRGSAVQAPTQGAGYVSPRRICLAGDVGRPRPRGGRDRPPAREREGPKSLFPALGGAALSRPHLPSFPGLRLQRRREEAAGRHRHLRGIRWGWGVVLRCNLSPESRQQLGLTHGARGEAKEGGLTYGLCPWASRPRPIFPHSPHGRWRMRQRASPTRPPPSCRVTGHPEPQQDPTCTTWGQARVRGVGTQPRLAQDPRTCLPGSCPPHRLGAGLRGREQSHTQLSCPECSSQRGLPPQTWTHLGRAPAALPRPVSTPLRDPLISSGAWQGQRLGGRRPSPTLPWAARLASLPCPTCHRPGQSHHRTSRGSAPSLPDSHARQLPGPALP